MGEFSDKGNHGKEIFHFNENVNCGIIFKNDS